MTKNKLITMSIMSMLIFVSSCKKSSDDTGSGSGNGNSNVQLPTVETAEVSAIAMTSATVGAKVTSDGGENISSRGICFSLKADPTIADGKTMEGSSTGSFTSVLSGLTNAAIYYARAYATNSKGTGYGKTITFAVLETGQAFQGGFLLYVFKQGDPGYKEGFAHGLVLAPAIQFSYMWTSGDYTITGASGTAIGTGSANTNAIVATLGSGSYAASQCFNAINLSYSDWYLPSKDELNLFYLLRDKIPGAPYNNYFWSSTDAGGTTAWIQSFETGVQSTYDKRGRGFATRAMRTF